MKQRRGKLIVNGTKHSMKHAHEDQEARGDVDPTYGDWRDLLDLSIPLHLYALRDFMFLREIGVDVTDEVAAAVLERAAGRASRIERLMVRPPDGVSVVYYMRIGNRCKIGTSGNLKTRLATINPEELLAVEPGDYRLENLRHAQFAPLRTHGEWFSYEGPLVEWVGTLRKAAKAEAA